MDSNATNESIDEITKRTGGRKPDWRATTPVSRKGKDFFREIGAGWNFENSNGKGVSLKLDALPIDGEIVLFETKD